MRGAFEAYEKNTWGLREEQLGPKRRTIGAYENIP